MPDSVIQQIEQKALSSTTVTPDFTFKRRDRTILTSLSHQDSHLLSSLLPEDEGAIASSDT